MSKEERISKLNQGITAAVYELEEAARKLSRLEEEMAKLTLPNSSEGNIARRGALRTAVLGRDERRAAELLAHYLSEQGADLAFRSELVRIFNE